MTEGKKRTTRPAAERAISLDLPITMTAETHTAEAAIQHLADMESPATLLAGHLDEKRKALLALGSPKPKLADSAAKPDGKGIEFA